MGNSSFKLERDSLLKEIRQAKPGTEAIQKLRRLREEFDLVVDGYKNSLKILSDTTYEDRKHFLLELIQNADDAIYDTDIVKLSFIITEQGLELYYNEKGFNVDDVIAITDTGDSTKSGSKRDANSFIGEKGIGFKSVFALAEEVEIESGPWHFSLNNDTVVVPKELPNQKNEEGTRLRISFKRDDTIEMIAEELKRFVDGEMDSFLFLHKISAFNLEDRRPDCYKNQKVEIIPANRQSKCLQLVTTPSNKTRKYLLYRDEVEFPGSLVKERWDKSYVNKIGNLKREFIAAALLDTHKEKKGRLFCFLPTSVRLPIPINLQVDGHLKADREKLHDPNNNSWNKYLLKKLPNFLLEAILDWRNTEIANNLIAYIPADKGNDQLKDVFQKLINLLQTENWVRTYGINSNWVSPDKAILGDSYWNDIFDEHPKIRLEAEKILNKRFVHRDWVSNSQLLNKLKKYKIEKIKEKEVVQILQSADLYPLLKDNSRLIKLYQYILNMKCIKKNYGRANRLNRSGIASCRIFPIEGDNFSYLKVDDESTNVFQIKSSKKQLTGLEGTIDFRLVNYNYTCYISLNKDESDRRKIIRERNSLLRKLLSHFDVPELKEETILSKLQISYLLENTEKDHDVLKRKYKVLGAIFKAYQDKEDLERSYLRKLKKIKNVIFQTTTGKYASLKNMILPESLQLKEDKLYSPSKLSEMYLPKSEFNFKERNSTKKHQNTIRDFLIYCGIKTDPVISVQEQQFRNAKDFQDEDENRFKIWKDRIDGDYRPQNMVTIEKVQLDEITKTLFKMKKTNMKLLSNKIYKIWHDKYQQQRVDLETLTNEHKPTPGYFRVLYTRRQKRSPLVRDFLWAGISREEIPLITITGEISFPNIVYWVDSENHKSLGRTKELLKIVSKDKNIKCGYDKKYLSSLEVSEICLSALNHLWEDLETNRYKEIIEAAIEIYNVTEVDDGLLLLDKEAKRLKPVTEFRLRKKNTDLYPSLKEQYGLLGERLGKLLGVIEESDTAYYLELVENILFKSGEAHSVELNKFVMLLNKWQSFSLNFKGMINGKIKELLARYKCTQKPVIVFNKSKLVNILKEADVPFINLELEEKETFRLATSIKEIGFDLLDDFGYIKVIGKESLCDRDSYEFQSYVKAFLRDLEPREQVKLEQTLSSYGPPVQWHKRIYRADSLHQIIDENQKYLIHLKLPYLDEKNYLLYVGEKEEPIDIIAHLLSLNDFTFFKSAKRDLNQVRKKITLKPNTKSDITSKDVATSVVQNLIKKKNIIKEYERISEWKNGLSSAEEELFRDKSSKQIKKSIENGPKYVKKKQRKNNKQSSDFKVVDRFDLNPKEFLSSEYRGKCQICGTVLHLSNGQKWIQTYRIQEKRDEHWWANQPYNILGLCPNCHVLAKHGGSTDFSNILKAARKLIKEEIFPEEVEEYQGDYYTVHIRINNQRKRLVLSKTHLNYFSSLLLTAEMDDEETAVTKED